MASPELPPAPPVAQQQSSSALSRPEKTADDGHTLPTTNGSLVQVPTPEPEWAHGFQLFTILTAVTFVVFLMLLDGTIVVAAVPRITDDFNSLNDIGWYGAAYQLGRYVNWTLESNGYHEQTRN